MQGSLGEIRTVPLRYGTWIGSFWFKYKSRVCLFSSGETAGLANVASSCCRLT
jgi:hypothetical protein